MVQSILRSGFWPLLMVVTACGTEDVDLALGTLERDRIVLTATASEVIIEVLVQEGQTVTAGQLLLRLDDRRQNARLAQAAAEVARAEAQLEELRNGARDEQIAAARARLEGAEAGAVAFGNQSQRIASLYEQKLVAKAEFDQALAQSDSAKAAVKDAREQWQLLLAGTRVEQLRQAEAQLAATQAVLELENKVLADLSVTSTRAGRVDSLPSLQGDRVAVGAVLAVVLVEDRPYARVYLPQRFRANLREGSELQVRVDGVDQPFSGRIRTISAEPAFTPFYALNQKERTHLVYLTEVVLGEDAVDLPAGLTAQVLLPAHTGAAP
jgi:HlyD family secretion protein